MTNAWIEIHVLMRGVRVGILIVKTYQCNRCHSPSQTLRRIVLSVDLYIVIVCWSLLLLIVIICWHSLSQTLRRIGLSVDLYIVIVCWSLLLLIVINCWHSLSQTLRRIGLSVIDCLLIVCWNFKFKIHINSFIKTHLSKIRWAKTAKNWRLSQVLPRLVTLLPERIMVII